MITVIDYGLGNTGSILNMLHKIGAAVKISSENSDIKTAERLVLPGVGSFNDGMGKLKSRGLVSILNEKVLKDRTPILGVCLGMQLFTLGSQEGKLEGLGWLDAQTVKFNFTDEHRNLKIPHMGWNNIKVKAKSCIFNLLNEEARFYFAHSYHVVCNNENDVASTTTYGYEFVSSFQHDNIFGVQFHPEKSHKFGMQILKNFVEC